jgi:FkbM family methyltransferase
LTPPFIGQYCRLSLSAWRFWGNLLSGFSLVEVRTYNGMTYSLALPGRRDAHEQNLAQTGGFCHVQEILLALCPAGSLVLDIGANIGSVTIPLALRNIRVAAYDILPENIEAIALAARANGVESLIRTRHAAAWHEAGELSIIQSNTLAVIKTDGEVKSATGATPAVRLSDEIPASEPVSAMKVDVEGAELNVFRGAEAILRAHRPHIVFETFPHGLRQYGASAAEMFGYLTDLGYDLYRMTWQILSPGYMPPAEQVVVDYLATTMPPDELGRRTGYQIRPMTSGEIVDQIKLQDTLWDCHRQYVLSIADLLPEAVRADPAVSALLQRWSADYAGGEEIGLLRAATLGHAADAPGGRQPAQ